MIECQAEHAEEDEDGVVGSTTALVLDPFGVSRGGSLASVYSELELVSVAGDHVGEQALDGAGPLEALGVTAPALEDHVEQGALHGPEGTLSRVEVVLLLEELVDQHLGADVQHEGIFPFKGVEGTDGQHGEEQRRRDILGIEGGRVQEGQMVVIHVEVSGQVSVQDGCGGHLEGLRQAVEAVIGL